MDRLRQPFVVGVAIGAVFVVGGFVAIAITYAGVSRTLVVGDQIAFSLSGGLGALAAIGFGAAVVTVQLRRREDALDDRHWAGLVDGLADALGGLSLAPPLSTEAVVAGRRVFHDPSSAHAGAGPSMGRPEAELAGLRPCRRCFPGPS